MNFSSVNALTSADWTHHFQRMERLHAGLAIPSIAADGGVEAESVVISAFLTSIRNVHQGAFSWRRGKNTSSALRRAVEDLILNSPGLCATLGRPSGSRLIVLHDQEPSSVARWRPWPGVELRRVELKDTDAAVSNDDRWSLFEQALRADARWECAYAIDLTDVRVLALPPCAALPAEALVLASDDTHHCCRQSGKRWLEGKANLTRFNETWGREYQSFVRGRYAKHWLWNSGVVGGRRQTFAPALANVTAMLRAHWARHPRLAEPGRDTLPSN